MSVSGSSSGLKIERSAGEAVGLQLGDPRRLVGLARAQPVGAAVAAVAGAVPQQKTGAELKVLPAEGEIDRILTQAVREQRARVPSYRGLVDRNVGGRLVADIGARCVGAVGEGADNVERALDPPGLAKLEGVVEAGRHIALDPAVGVLAQVGGRAAVPGIALGEVGEARLQGRLQGERADRRRGQGDGIRRLFLGCHFLFGNLRRGTFLDRRFLDRHLLGSARGAMGDHGGERGDQSNLVHVPETPLWGAADGERPARTQFIGAESAAGNQRF